MAERSAFEDLYGVLTNTTSISNGVSADATTFNSATVNDLFTAGDIGVESNIYAIPLIGHPAINHGQNILDVRKSTGLAYRHAGTGMEFQQTTRQPSTTWNFEVTAWNIAPFLWTLFQAGTSQAGATTYVKTFIPYAEADQDFEAWLTLIRKMSDGTANSHVAGGMIARSINFTAESGGALNANIEMIGYNSVTDFDLDAQASLLNFSTRASLLWQNATITLDGTPINIDGINFTITNNATSKFYDNVHPTKHLLGDFGVEGTVVIPWAQATEGANSQITKFIAGTDSALVVYWGNSPASANGDIAFSLNIRYTGAEPTTDDEIQISCPFLGVHDGTNTPCSISVCDSVDRGIS